MKIPGSDGEVRICTSMTPVVQFVHEMARHAAEAKVDGPEVIGYLPAMGCALGAGTIVKEIAAAVPSILKQPEASEPHPFMCRIEPKAKPSLCALIALGYRAANGDAAANGEWNALAAAAEKGGASAISKAMLEAISCLKKAA
jgi:hypothetical protein